MTRLELGSILDRINKEIASQEEFVDRANMAGDDGKVREHEFCQGGMRFAKAMIIRIANAEET